MPSATAIAEAHREVQARNAAITAALVARYYRVIDSSSPASIERTAAAWLAAVIPLIRARRRQSIRLAERYYELVHEEETGDKFDYLVPEGFELIEEQARRSLAYLGVFGLTERIRKGVDPAEAFSKAQAEAAGAAVRHVANGGREVILDAVQKDRRAVGWQRVTRVNPCYFCAMLASRGPVYKEDSFDESDPRFEGGIGEHKVHDACKCFLVPVYSRTTEMPGPAKRFQDLWNETTGDVFGKDKVRAFRRAYNKLGSV